MAIINTEVKTYRATTNDETSSNGGRINDALLVADNTARNFFPDLYNADRTAGTDHWRKFGARMEDSDNSDATDVDLYIARPLADGARIYIRPGDQTDTQGAMSSSRYYGVGTLDANLSISDTEVDIALVDPTVTQFADGDAVYFINASSPWAVIEDGVISGAPSGPSGSILTITLASGVSNAMTASAVYVAAAWRTASLAKSISSFTDGSAAGSLDDTQIALRNIGGIYQVFTITFTSATAFNLSGDTLGADFANGVIGSTFEPVNPNTSTPLFSIPSGAWSGTHATSDTYSFTYNPIILPYWLLRDPPASMSPASNTTIDLRGRVHSV